MKKGFTLIELLVVVLIIGVLSAIAIPMYQGAVDKSHWSTMLPGAKAIKDAEEAFKMSNDGYTDTMANLDVTMENSDLTFSLITPNNTSDPNVIRVTNSKLANVRLASYLDDNPKFAGQLHCEALTGDERANRLCDKLLMGQELTSADGYTGYLLDQSIDKATCDNANRSWSSSKTKCYKTDQERCQALGVSLISEGQCGYKDTQNQIIGEEMLCNGAGWAGCNGATVNEGGVCQGNNQNSCRNTIINNGGTCLGSWDHGACAYATVNNGGMCIAETWDGCLHATVNAGGTCWAKGGSTIYPSYMFMCSGSTLNGGTCKADQDYTCRGVTINAGGVCEANVANTCAGSYGSAELTVNDGGVCKANAPNTCVGTYNGTGCCEGTYCPSDAPKCS